jgi:hypothetical protein
MNALTALYKDLLFLNGHIAEPSLAVALTTPTPLRAGVRTRSNAMNFFKSLMYLGGLESVDLRINDDGSPYQPYGNRVASAAAFGPGPHVAAPKRERRQADRRRGARAAAQPAACH